MVANHSLRTPLTCIDCYSGGEVVSISIFGRNLVILNSAKAAFDLLHKRSSIYSDRPYMAMGGDL